MNLNLKLYHWQTKSYSRHKATCQLYDILSEKSDEFIEVYMGKYQRPEFKDNFTILIKELNDKNAKELLEEYVSVLKKEISKYIKQNDTDLMNIRDEMLSAINKTIYLFTLE